MLYFRALASGSSGNSFLLRTGKVSLLFDAGLRLSALRRHLLAEHIDLSQINAVLISHEHRDHCAAAPDLASQYGVQVWANADVLRAAGVHEAPGASLLEVGSSVLFGDVEVVTFPVEHDAIAPVGFLIRTQGKSITIATDLGQVTPAVADAVCRSELVVLEANHDPEMLQSGRYPHHLRRRVSGPRGHLSNYQAGAVLAGNLRDQDTEVWLAHLSKENNTATLAVRTVQKTLRAAGLGEVRVGVAGRDKPSLRWHGATRPRQLSLFESVSPA